jgi:tetratricopeptide (TPR) repeat protein
MTDPDREAGRRGMALVAAERFELAIPLLRSGLSSSPQDVALLNNIAYSLLRTGHGREALDAATAASALDAENEWSHRLRALALADVGRVRQALEASRVAQRIAPNLWITHTTVAQMQLRLGRFDDAEVAARRAIALAPHEPGPHIQLACVLHDQGRLIDARTSVDRALRLDPGSASARVLLGMIDRAELIEPAARANFLAAAATDPLLSSARTQLSQSVLYGGLRTAGLWRALFKPWVLGVGFGAWGLTGFAAAAVVLTLIRTLLIEIRLWKLPRSARPFIRRQRWANVRPASMAKAARPRLVASKVMYLVRSKVLRILLSAGYAMTVAFALGWLIGDALG